MYSKTHLLTGYSHHLNAAPIFLTINKMSWVPQSIKVRLLEWKMRFDVIEYVGRGCPTLHADILKSYKPKDAQLVSKPQDLLPRFHALPDDGHTIKVVRALLIAQQESGKYAGRPWLRIKEDDWLRIHYMLLDGVEGQSSQWVRSAGFEEAWKEVPELSRANL